MRSQDFPSLFVGRDREIQQVERQVVEISKNPSPKVVLFSGIAGIGKTTLLNALSDRLRSQREILIATAAALPPSQGAVATTQLQPFGLMQQLLERIHAGQSTQAKKRLWVNIGLTLLTTLPFAGDLIYAIKEISRDMREYKKEQQGETPSAETLQEEYVRFLSQVAQQQILVLMVDNLEWSDTESLHVFHQVLNVHTKLPILPIGAYHPGSGEQSLRRLRQLPMAKEIVLEPLSEEAIQQWLKMVFPDATIDPGVAQWLQHKTGGIPALIEEYLRMLWLSDRLTIAERGLTVERCQQFQLPDSITAYVHRWLSELPEEDQLLLQLCSAEGVEATVFIQSQLMGWDVLTTVRRLKKLQRMTGLLRSRGAERRYGVKTTVFAFTHPLYQQVLFETLEYEERQALMVHLESILSQRLKQCQTTAEEMEILPALWNYAIQAEDRQQIQQIAEQLGQTMVQQGGRETLIRYAQQLEALSVPMESPTVAKQLATLSLVDGAEWQQLIPMLFLEPEHLKRVIIQLLRQQDYKTLSQLVAEAERLENLTLSAKELIEFARFCSLLPRSSSVISQAKRLMQQQFSDPELQLFVAVIAGREAINQQQIAEAEPFVQQAASIARSLSLPGQLLALALITRWYYHRGDNQYRLYWQRLQHIVQTLDMSIEDVQQVVFH